MIRKALPNNAIHRMYATDIILQSWICGQWIGRGLNIKNVQYLAKGQITCTFMREQDTDRVVEWG
eukprot:c48693_g1_i1 orf=55-249(+)